MLRLILNYFTFSRLKKQISNKRLSFLMFYDKGTTISNKSRIERFAVIRQSSINDYSYIGYNSNINTATIGKFCSISKNVSVGLTTHPTNFLSTSPIFFSTANGTGYQWTTEDVYDDKPKRVTVGHDVWIGMNATIMGGLTIGNGAIIAAHSVVTKDVPPYAIVGGIPAKIIKYRFPENVIDKIQKLNWWDLTEEKFKLNIRSFQKEISDENEVLLK